MGVVLSALSLLHALPQLRKLKSNLVLPVPTLSASPTILPAKKSNTRRDAQLLSTNTAHTLEDMLMLDLSDMLSNVKLKLKLTHKFSVMVVSITDSDMLDMPTMPQSLSPSPPPSRLAMLSPRSPAHPPSTPSPRLLAKPELPKSWNTPSSTMELTSDKHLKPKSFKTAI